MERCPRVHCDERHEQVLSATVATALRQRDELAESLTRLQRELDIARRRLAWIRHAATEGYMLPLRGAQYVPTLAITNALGLTDDVRYITIAEAA